jgi:hypothetical protein
MPGFRRVPKSDLDADRGTLDALTAALPEREPFPGEGV